MTVRFRPYDPNRRFVWPIGGRRRLGRRRWLALHSRTPDWRALFERALALMLLEATGRAWEIELSAGAGRLRWRGGSRWSIIDVDLTGMREAKRAVVATALLKAARYSR